MRSGVLPARVVHVHPTRACNLACVHCYSTSSPSVRSSLDPDVLIDTLAGLREEGFEVLSLSGGEPLVYRGLNILVRAASDLGYRVHIVTNGLLLTERRLASLHDHVHLVAVSFDGAEETHNRVRGRADAFAKANAALDVLASADVPFGLAFAVSRWSLPDVPWAFERARALGADLLHLRPLVPEGRAKELTESWMLTGADSTRLALLGHILNGGPGTTPRIQVDLIAVQELPAAMDQFELLRREPSVVTLSDAVNPLVIDEQGRLLAFTYGIHPQFVIANVKGDWRRDAARFKAEALGSIADLLEATFHGAVGESSQYVDFFANLTRVSHQVGVPRAPPFASRPSRGRRSVGGGGR
jgi:organic radical activating enzyme